jgi:hypothetical protein
MKTSRGENRMAIDGGLPPDHGLTALVVALGIITATRRIMGPTFCRVMVVGDMRAVLEAAAPAGPPQTALGAATAGARDALRAHCDRCQRCRLGQG